MKKHSSALLALTLAACSKSPAMPPREGAPDSAVRMAMPEGEALPGVRDGASQAAWAAGADGLSARYGHPGEPPLVSIACREGVLVVTRHAAAPVGAQALFALVGSAGIMRLPVDATSVPGQRGYIWQGAIAANDSRTKVLAGSYNGTLPGAGMIKVSSGSAVRDLIARCRRDTPASAPQPATPASEWLPGRSDLAELRFVGGRITAREELCLLYPVIAPGPAREGA